LPVPAKQGSSKPELNPSIALVRIPKSIKKEVVSRNIEKSIAKPDVPIISSNKIQATPLEDGMRSVNSECSASRTIEQASLKGGPASGDFSDYGFVKSIDTCIGYCCKDDCDAAFVVNSTCYTVKCHSIATCQPVRASSRAKVPSQVAFVIRKDDKSRKLKLNSIKRFVASMTDSSLSSAPTKPKVLTKVKELPQTQLHEEKCQPDKVELNRMLVGGTQAGFYNHIDKVKDMNGCLSACCNNPECDAAFMVANKCYSIQCYDKCETQNAQSRRLSSAIAFVKRKDKSLSNKKRTLSSSLLAGERQYKVTLNVTVGISSPIYETQSLEYIDFIQGLRMKISDVFDQMEGFKDVEILKINHGGLVECSLVVTSSMRTETLIHKLSKAIETNDRIFEEAMKDHLYQLPILMHMEGFQFQNSKGENLICSAEHDYDVYWPFAEPDTTVSVHCPRNGQGQAVRYCVPSPSAANASTEEGGVRWGVPDFSGCVSQKYTQLLHEIRSRSSSHPTTILSRLKTMVVMDTYSSEDNLKSEHSIDNTKAQVTVHPSMQKFLSTLGLTSVLMPDGRLNVPQLQLCCDDSAAKSPPSDIGSLYSCCVAKRKRQLMKEKEGNAQKRNYKSTILAGTGKQDLELGKKNSNFQHKVPSSRQINNKKMVAMPNKQFVTKITNQEMKPSKWRNSVSKRTKSHQLPTGSIQRNTKRTGVFGVHGDSRPNPIISSIRKKRDRPKNRRRRSISVKTSLKEMLESLGRHKRSKPIDIEDAEQGSYTQARAPALKLFLLMFGENTRSRLLALA
jgi:hypothetical protein